jgi:anti-anti-sigma factor
MTLEKTPAVENAQSSLGFNTRGGCPALFEVSISHMDDRTLVVLAGELDDATVPALHNALLDHIEHLKDHLVLDIGMLTFLDSSGLGLFVTVHKKLESKGCKLTIFAPTPMARRVLEITGLTEVLTIQPAKDLR